MPVYEYSCKSGCDNFEVWRTIDARTVDTNCPVCGSNGSRIYTAPMTICGPLRLKTESREPTIVRKETTASGSSKPNLRQSTTRPWMLNRGC